MCKSFTAACEKIAHQAKLYYSFNESILKVEDGERELLNVVKSEKLITVLNLVTLETFNIRTESAVIRNQLSQFPLR